MSRTVGLVLALSLVSASAAMAQEGLFSRGGGGALAIEADNGIEWRQDEKVYIASGNAMARRGEVTVRARRLIAHYREGTNGSNDIYRVEADQDVFINTPTEQAEGSRAVYDVDQQVLVLTGNNLRLLTGRDIVTARDSLEYWDTRKVAVARGSAVATQDDKRIQADTLVAHLEEAPKTKETRISKVDAFGGVRVSTKAEIAQGSKGVYNIIANTATLVGDVRVTHGRNQMNGDYADVNLNTGISRILSGPAAGVSGQRVRALLVPKEGETPAGAQDPAAAAGFGLRPAKRSGS